MTKIIAHRGFSSQYPENTMLAFRKAVEAGCDGIEMDVHLSRDGQVVIVHDGHLSRVTGGRTGRVADLTAQELSRIDVSKDHPLSYGFNGVPTLEEYFAYIQDKDVFSNIELKTIGNPNEGLEEKVIDLIGRYGLLDKVLFSSFNHQTMVNAKRLSPQTRCAFLTDNCMCGPGAYAKQYGVDFINPLYLVLNDENIAEMHGQGIGIQAWTVDDEEAMRYLLARNIYGIITNRPDRLKQIREETKGG